MAKEEKNTVEEKKKDAKESAGAATKRPDEKLSTKSHFENKHTSQGNAGATKNDRVEELKEEPEVKQMSIWKFVLAFAIVLILFAAVLLWSKYAQTVKKENNQYNGFDFTEAQGGLWIVRIDARGQPYDIPFYNHPKDLDDIIVGANVTAPIYEGPSQIVISVDPDAPSKVVVAGVEIARITGSKYNLFNIPTSSALSKPAATKMDIPVMTCANATQDRVVVMLMQGRDNIIVSKGNCVVLQYSDINDSVRVADRYAYSLLKIMD